MDRRMLGLAMLLCGGIPSFTVVSRPVAKIGSKLCRFCRKPHNHHNLYCSAECCKADKQKEKPCPELS